MQYYLYIFMKGQTVHIVRILERGLSRQLLIQFQRDAIKCRLNFVEYPVFLCSVFAAIYTY